MVLCIIIDAWSKRSSNCFFFILGGIVDGGDSLAHKFRRSCSENSADQCITKFYLKCQPNTEEPSHVDTNIYP